MRELSIGMVGMGSSHPEAFADVFENIDSVSVSTVWDDGDVRDDEYVEWFCNEYDARRANHLDDMVDAVDGIMIESVDWDRHRELAVPFLEAGVPTFIEKPIAGRRSDVDAIGQAAKAGGAPLFGGSGIPFHPVLSDVPRDVSGRTLFGTSYNDPFYYGVHIVDTIRYLIGANWTGVSPIDGPGTVVAIEFENDTNAILRLEEPETDSEFAILDVSDRVRAQPIPL
jgi:hypothetical protein